MKDKLIKVKAAVGKVLAAYLKNIFDGKITTLAGAVMFSIGIGQAVKGGITAEVFEFCIAGLILAGCPDPRVPKK